MQSISAALSDYPELDVVFSDFKNAFNLVDRKKMMIAVKRWFPDLLPFFKACYGASTAAWVQGIGGVYEILSERGVHRGDPLGCIGFALAVRHLFVKANELAGGDVIKGGFAKAYLDDLTTVSTFERTINILKCSIYVRELLYRHWKRHGGVESKTLSHFDELVDNCLQNNKVCSETDVELMMEDI